MRLTMDLIKGALFYLVSMLIITLAFGLVYEAVCELFRYNRFMNG